MIAEAVAEDLATDALGAADPAPARSLFGFSPLGYLDILTALGAGLFSVAWFETLKLRRRSASAGG